MRLNSARIIAAPGSRSDGLRIRQLPVTVAVGIDHSGIMAGKSIRVRSVGDETSEIFRSRHTERTYCGDNSKGLSIGPCLHVFGYLQNFPCQLSRNTARSLSDLQPSQHVAFGIFKCLSLLQCDICCQSVPMLPYQSNKFEHDLLPMEDTRGSPCWKRPFCTFNSSLKLFIRTLGNPGNKIICCWVIQIYPRSGFRRDELIVHEVMGVLG